MSFPPPPDEAARQESLQPHGILDTPPDPDFDRITRLARQLLHAPLAFVWLVDRDRQSLQPGQSRDQDQGLSLPPQMPRANAFCAHTILSDEVLVVPDATLDARFAANPLVVESPHVRFYAGAPLLAHDGRRLGALAVMDTAPRELSQDELATLRELAGAVAEMLEEQRLKQQARDEAERRGRELARADAERQATQERLRLLESVVVTANDAILITQAEPIAVPGPRIVYVNKAFTRMTGYSSQEVLGQTPRLLQGPGTEREPRDKIRAALEKWQPVQVELLNYQKDGTPFWVELSIVPVANEKGWFTHWVSIQRDITERREAEAAIRQGQERYTRIAANTPGMVYQFVLHPDGSVDWPFVSQGCRELYGVEPSFVQANPLYLIELIHPEDLIVFQQSIAVSAQTLEPWQWEGRFAHFSGGERWGQAAARPERLSNGDTLWDGVTLDITARKRAEAALQQAKDEAEAARAGAERANRAKSEFLSRMSHELRTPLNAILGFGQLLEMDELNTEQRQGVGQILKGGRHLLELINEVLDIARIEAGRMTLSLEPVSVRDIVREVLDLAAPLAAGRSVRLSEPACAPDAFVLADRQKLKQILLNLVSNAIKYNREGGQVSIACFQTPDAEPQAHAQVLERELDHGSGSSQEDSRAQDWRAAGEWMSIEVEDTGPGLTPQDVGRLFTPFERLGADGSGVEGTGIGLALSKGLAEMMGGQIGVRSVPGQGSTFFIELPRAEDPLTRHEQDARSTGDFRPHAEEGRALQTVLYIEDNSSNLKLIERILARRGGLRLLATMQGGLGLELAREQKPDLILLDLHLPDIPGDEVLRHLRQDAATRDIPVVVLSADATPNQIQRLLRAGARAYLTKPLDIEQFGRALDEHLAQPRALA